MTVRLTKKMRELIASISEIATDGQLDYPELASLETIPERLDLPEIRWAKIAADVMTFNQKSAAANHLYFHCLSASGNVRAFDSAVHLFRGLESPDEFAQILREAYGYEIGELDHGGRHNRKC